MKIPPKGDVAEPRFSDTKDMDAATTPIFTVCNTDGIPVSEYDSLAMAISACEDLAREAAWHGDFTNGYYVQDVDDFDGFLAKDFVK